MSTNRRHLAAERQRRWRQRKRKGRRMALAEISKRARRRMIDVGLITEDEAMCGERLGEVVEGIVEAWADLWER